MSVTFDIEFPKKSFSNDIISIDESICDKITYCLGNVNINLDLVKFEVNNSHGVLGDMNAHTIYSW